MLSSLPPERDYKYFIPNPSHTSPATIVNKVSPQSCWLSNCTILTAEKVTRGECLRPAFQSADNPCCCCFHQKGTVSCESRAKIVRTHHGRNGLIVHIYRILNHTVLGRIRCQIQINRELPSAFSSPPTNESYCYTIWTNLMMSLSCDPGQNGTGQSFEGD